MVKDLGGSFGKATLLNSSKMKLSDWDSTVIWKDAKQCIGEMPRSFTGSLEDPKIGEAGRQRALRRGGEVGPGVGERPTRKDDGVGHEAGRRPGDPGHHVAARAHRRVHVCRNFGDHLDPRHG